MKNIERHITHWISGSIEAIETAEILLAKRKISFGLFFCHLSIEKLLKALFIKNNKEFPPKTHKLLLLANNIEISIDQETKLFLSELMRFQLEGRYPELNFTSVPYEVSEKILLKTKRVLLWLKTESNL